MISIVRSILILRLLYHQRRRGTRSSTDDTSSRLIFYPPHDRIASLISRVSPVFPERAPPCPSAPPSPPPLRAGRSCPGGGAGRASYAQNKNAKVRRVLPFHPRPLGAGCPGTWGPPLSFQTLSAELLILIYRYVRRLPPSLRSKSCGVLLSAPLSRTAEIRHYVEQMDRGQPAAVAGLRQPVYFLIIRGDARCARPVGAADAKHRRGRYVATDVKCRVGPLQF